MNLFERIVLWISLGLLLAVCCTQMVVVADLYRMRPSTVSPPLFPAAVSLRIVVEQKKAETPPAPPHEYGPTWPLPENYEALWRRVAPEIYEGR